MKKSCAMAMILLSSTIAIGLEKTGETLQDARTAADRETALNTVAYINRLNYAYTVMKTYQNVIAIQDMHDMMSLDGIDLRKIPAFTYEKTAMVDLIKEMLKSLSEMKMAEEDHEFYQKKIEDSRRRAKKEMWLKLLTSMPAAIKSGADAVHDGLSQGGNPYVVAGEAVLAVAGNVVGAPVEAILNYDKTLYEMQVATSEEHFKYNRKKANKVHEAHDRLLSAEWAFVHEKNLQSEDISSPKELQALVNALKVGDAEKVYKVLNTEDMRRHYPRFADYWYYLASFAVVVKDWDVAIEAAKRFFQEHRGLQKVDKMTAQVAVAGVTAIIGKGRKDPNIVGVSTEDKKLIGEWLDKVRWVNGDASNPDYSYFCADIYYHILCDSKTALEILAASNAYIEGNFESKLVEYRNLYSKGEVTMDESQLPKNSDLIRIRTLYNDILKDNRDLARLEKNALNLCRNRTSSSVEKLFYVGRVRVDDLWGLAKQDVLAIKMRYIRPTFRSNKFTVELPVSWFLLGEVESKVMLCRGAKVAVTLTEERAERKIRTNESGIGTDIVTMTFFCKRKMLPGVDSVKLSFAHPSWPIEVMYKPSLAFDVQAGEGQESTTEYVPVKIKFMGSEKDLTSPPVNVRETIEKDKKKHYSHYLQPFQFGEVVYRTNFLNAISIDQDRTFKVSYTNPTPYKTDIDLSVRYYTKYGALLCEVEAEEKLTKESGGEWKLSWPADMLGTELPAYIMFQYHVENDVFDKWRRKCVEAGEKEVEEFGK